MEDFNEYNLILRIIEKNLVKDKNFDIGEMEIIINFFIKELNLNKFISSVTFVKEDSFDYEVLPYKKNTYGWVDSITREVFINYQLLNKCYGKSINAEMQLDNTINNIFVMLHELEHVRHLKILESNDYVLQKNYIKLAYEPTNIMYNYIGDSRFTKGLFYKIMYHLRKCPHEISEFEFKILSEFFYQNKTDRFLAERMADIGALDNIIRFFAKVDLSEDFMAKIKAYKIKYLAMENSKVPIFKNTDLYTHWYGGISNELLEYFGVYNPNNKNDKSILLMSDEELELYGINSRQRKK